jgi:hypothetical protein
MKQYCVTGRRNHCRALKRLLDTWDRNGSTRGLTPWQIDDDDDCLVYTFILFRDSETPWRWHFEAETCWGNVTSTIKTVYNAFEHLLDTFHVIRERMLRITVKREFVHVRVYT